MFKLPTIPLLMCVLRVLIGISKWIKAILDSILLYHTHENSQLTILKFHTYICALITCTVALKTENASPIYKVAME